MKKLPLGIQSFKEIIASDCIYVDKTRYIYNLINDVKYYFLSRPRRFGKSLLLDTIAEVFNGDRELFKGLWIYNSGYNFEKHPVIRLDMSNIANKTPEILENALMLALQGRIHDEGFDIESGIPSYMFTRLIELLYRKYNEPVVVLIDEYDKPILDHLDDIETAQANRKAIRGFYDILKSMDPYLKFTLITGVTKFTKTSIFSGLNNLLDITLAEDYANICGIPTESLGEYFGEHIADLEKNKAFRQYNSIHDEILAWYDGYSWNGETKLLNPFSLLSFFKLRKFESYWFASGAPWLLIDMIKKKPESFLNLENLKITERVLDTFDIHRIELESLLFQTGYLTVKEVLQTRGSPIYVLDMPNAEVREAFNLQNVSTLTESGDVRAEQTRMEIGDALQKGDLQKMLEMLRGLFANYG